MVLNRSEDYEHVQFLRANNVVGWSMLNPNHRADTPDAPKRDDSQRAQWDSMTFASFTSNGMHVSWRLLNVLGAVLVVALSIFGVGWLILSQVALERSLDQMNLANAALGPDGGVDRLAGDYAPSDVRTASLLALTAKLIDGLYDNHLFIEDMVLNSDQAWVAARLDFGEAQGWIGGDPLFSPDLFNGGIIQTDAVQPENAPFDGSGGVDSKNGNSANQILARNSDLLLQAETVLDGLPAQPSPFNGQSLDAIGSAGDLNRALTSNMNALPSLVSTLDALQQAAQELQQDNQALNIQLTSARLAKRNADLQIDQLANQLSAAQTALEVLGQEFSQANAQQTALEKQLMSADKADTYLEDLMAQARAAVQQSSQNFDLLNSELAEQHSANSQLIAQNQEFAGSAQQRDELQAELALAQKRLTVLAGELAAMDARLTASQQENIELKMQLGRLGATPDVSLVALVPQSVDDIIAATSAQEEGDATAEGNPGPIRAEADPADPILQNLLDVAVEVAMAGQTLETTQAIRFLEDALTASQDRVTHLEAELSRSVVNQRFAEAEYSRALARAERLTIELERRFEALSSTSETQDQLLALLKRRYGRLLETTKTELTAIYPHSLDLMDAPKPLWPNAEENNQDIGGFAFQDAGVADEFGGPSLSSDEIDLLGVGDDQSHTLELAVSLDQSLASLEALQFLEANIPVGSPVAFTRISSHFGPRLHPLTKTYRPHKGIDLVAPIGTPIFAPAPGVVITAGWRGGFGRFVEIQHASGVVTRYAHLSRISVKAGQQLSQSDKLGEVGKSGQVTGPHLHYEIRVNGTWVDPRTWIKATRNVLTQ